MVNDDKRSFERESARLLGFAKRHGFSLSTFLSSLSWVARCGIFVLDENGFSIGGYLLPYIDSPAAERALHFGALPADFFAQLRRDGALEAHGVRHSLHAREVSGTGRAYILLISVPGQAAEEDAVCTCTAEYVSFRISRLIGEQADISLLSQSLNDILRGKIRGIDDIKHILRDERQKPYYISGVVEFDDGVTNHRRYLQLVNRLRAMCVEVKPTIFKGKIVVLMQAAPQTAANDSMIRPKWEKSIFRDGYDYDSLNAVLAEETASISVNAALHELTLLPDAVDALMSVADISKKFKLCDDYDRIFLFDDYQSLVIAKQYFEGYLETHSPSALKLFIFPKLIPLLRYDYLNSQNLSAVLYKYITYRCDAALTAKALFMHRNTVYNKIRQIQEITGLSFSNTASMSMIMDSLKLYFLLTSYFNIDVIEIMFGRLPPKPGEGRAD